jgi:NifU-like protein involved in Fe-S cluster formation
MSAAVLYTPEVLALATALAEFPLSDDFALRGDARSRTCGSAITLGLVLDEDARIAQVGVRAHACAVGQAAAAIFAKAAGGRDLANIAQATQAIEDWLNGDSRMPAWPGLDAIAAAQAYPARHGAIMLAWRAARDLLCSQTNHR